MLSRHSIYSLLILSVAAIITFLKISQSRESSAAPRSGNTLYWAPENSPPSAKPVRAPRGPAHPPEETTRGSDQSLSPSDHGAPQSSLTQEHLTLLQEGVSFNGEGEPVIDRSLMEKNAPRLAEYETELEARRLRKILESTPIDTPESAAAKTLLKEYQELPALQGKYQLIIARKALSKLNRQQQNQ